MPTISERIEQLSARYVAIDDHLRAAEESHVRRDDLSCRVWDVLEDLGVGGMDDLVDLPDAVAAGACDKINAILCAVSGEIDKQEQVDQIQMRFDPPREIYPDTQTWAPAAAFEGRGAPAAGDEALPNLDLSDAMLVARYGDQVAAATAVVLNDLANDIHCANIQAGWWSNIHTGEPKSRNVFEMLALVHSEISEALEHHRKGTMDDKLPDRPGIEVELADAMIRMFDLAAALRLDLGGAIMAKLAFNATRADHQIANRLLPGGKAA